MKSIVGLNSLIHIMFVIVDCKRRLRAIMPRHGVTFAGRAKIGEQGAVRGHSSSNRGDRGDLKLLDCEERGLRRKADRAKVVLRLVLLLVT